LVSLGFHEILSPPTDCWQEAVSSHNF
jgi:hypothetical protein